jgi:hypothetical protein
VARAAHESSARSRPRPPGHPLTSIDRRAPLVAVRQCMGKTLRNYINAVKKFSPRKHHHREPVHAPPSVMTKNSGCPACRGRHRAHTCGVRSSGSAAAQRSKPKQNTLTSFVAGGGDDSDEDEEDAAQQDSPESRAQHARDEHRGSTLRRIFQGDSVSDMDVASIGGVITRAVPRGLQQPPPPPIGCADVASLGERPPLALPEQPPLGAVLQLPDAAGDCGGARTAAQATCSRLTSHGTPPSHPVGPNPHRCRWQQQHRCTPSAHLPVVRPAVHGHARAVGGSVVLYL